MQLSKHTLLIAVTAVTLSAAEGSFEKSVRPFLANNCFVCHNSKLKSGGLDLQQLAATARDLVTHRDTWELVVSKLKSGAMPPKGAPRPDPAAVTAVTRGIEAGFARADRNAPPNPGHVTARRLNRYEYNNTIRDLLAVNFRPADDFPADDSGYGFDNIGDVLSLSPTLMEKYLAAAEKIAKLAIAADPLPKPTVRRHARAEDLSETKGPGLIVRHDFPLEGDYYISIGIGGRPDPLEVGLTIDGRPVDKLPVESGIENRRLAERKVHIAAGDHRIAAELIPAGPPVPDPGVSTVGKKVAPLANPNAGFIEVRGPYDPVAPPPSESEKHIFVCGHSAGHHTPECARTDLAAFARRAWRRPVSDSELDGLVRFVDLARRQGDSFEQGMRIALEAVLVSPHFLFRIERDPNPDTPGAAHNIDSFELASRLSYFLWSSMPDEQLLRLAEQHELRRNLDSQIRRMLLDPKAHALVDNFGGQWLELRNLDSIKPDPDKFPMFSDALRNDMKKETELFFEWIIRQDRGILDFLSANYSFLNDRLARFYGIPGVEGPEFRRVQLPPDSHRGGLLGQASILTVSSYPARTSPVIRGKWILENILNAPPPPPPPNVPNLDEKAIGFTQSLRKQLEQHRADPVCSSCHAPMDPLGFGLENYDAIGRWRTHDGQFPIDASGALPNGKNFDGPDGLRRLLAADKDAFAQCLAEKLLTYALGRGLERFDRPAVQSIVRHTAAANYRFSALVAEIVKSLPFQSQVFQNAPLQKAVAQDRGGRGSK